MLYNNKFYTNSYEELLSFYPKFYRGVYEMEEILKTDGVLCDQLESNIEQALANSFIDSADEKTVALWENFLGISLIKQRTTEERRRMVKSFIIGSGKVSASTIIEMINAYTGAPVEVSFEPSDDAGNNRLIINFERGDSSSVYLSDIEKLISRKIPAHIDFKLNMNYGAEAVAYISFVTQIGTVDTFISEKFYSGNPVWSDSGFVLQTGTVDSFSTEEFSLGMRADITFGFEIQSGTITTFRTEEIK